MAGMSTLLHYSNSSLRPSTRSSQKSPPSPIRSNDESYRLDLLGLLADTDSRSGLHDCVFLVDKEKEDLGELKESIMSPSSLKKREVRLLYSISESSCDGKAFFNTTRNRNRKKCGLTKLF
jgi:hypothetical protein